MSATQKFFRLLFGGTGDRSAVPDTTPADGSVNYQTGYGFDYQRAASDGLRKTVERDKLNQVLYDITLGLRQYQTQGFPEFITAADNGGAAYSYNKNAFVLWTDGQVYVSTVAANTSDPSDVTKWQLAILGTGIGSIQDFPASTAPVGYLKANGALLSRTAYPALWAYAQASGNIAVSDGAWQKGQFSPGDGATTFRIPDARGYVRRAWDDGAGVDSGRVLGSVQADQMPSHAHGVNDPGHGHTLNDGGHSHGVSDPGHSHTTDIPVKANGSGAGPYAMVDGINGIAGTQATGSRGSGTGISIGYNGSNIGIFNAATGISTQTAGAGSEVRAKSIALLACIKYL